MGSAGLIFTLIFGVVIGIPCVAISWLGFKLLDKLGRYPSKTPAIQMSVLFKLIITEVVSFTLLLMLFKALS